ISRSAGPTPRIWKKWSITAMNSKPPSSAVRATVARSAPSLGGPSGVVKSGIWSPIFTLDSFSWRRRPVALEYGLQRPQERLAIAGRQGGEDLLLAGPDRGLHRSPQPVTRRGEREQVHAPVGCVGLALDQLALLQVVQHADDAALVRADGLRQRRLGSHRLLG